MSILTSLFPVNSFAAWSNDITWDSKADFDNNAVTTGTPTSNNMINTTAEGDATLIKPDTSGDTINGGWYHSFIIKNDGTLWATGLNQNGQLGTGELNGVSPYSGTSKDTWIQVASDVASVSGGLYHSLMIKKDGTLWATGYNVHGELGLGNTTQKNTWTQTSLSNVRQASAGYFNSIALKNDGTVWITGYNNYGQMGNGTTSPGQVTSWTQVTDSNINDGNPNTVDVVSVAAGAYYYLLAKADGSVWAVGYNNYGQLGTEDPPTNKYVWTRVKTSTGEFLSGITKVSSFYYNSLALKNDGTVWGAGYNLGGSLGLGNVNQTYLWTQSSTISDVVDINNGVYHSIALKSDDTYWVCGQGSNGALGMGDSIQRPSWTQAGDAVTAIASGGYHSLIRKADGLVRVTGNNTYGQLGNGDTIYRATWQDITLTGATKFSSGTNHQIALKPDGTVWTVGTNTYGQLGLGDATNRFVFSQTSLTNVRKVVAGTYYSVALKNDGTVWVCGYNNVGQLGIAGGQSNSWSQTALSGITDIAANNNHGIALKNDGTIYATGLNSNGQLGFGDTTNRTLWTQVPASSFGGNTISKIAVGWAYSIVMLSDGSLYAAGSNSTGCFGRGNTTSSNVWVAIPSVTASDLWAGGYQTVIKKSDGTLWVTGQNGSGQLGLGDTTQRNSFTQLPSSFNNPIEVAPHSVHTLILKSDNTLFSAGLAYFGETATGEGYDIQKSFVQVGSDVAAVATGVQQSIILKNDGKIQTVGWNPALGISVPGEGLRLSFLDSLTNAKRPNAYYSPATISNLKINASDGNVYKWNSLSWSADVTGTSYVKFRTRGATSEANLANASWSDYYSVPSAYITTPASQWLEIEMTLGSTDSLSTPVLHSFMVNYFTDLIDPSNPSVASAWNNAQKATSIANDTFSNVTQPYFEFSGASDEEQGSGVKGYYVYFGQDSTALPLTAGTYQSHIVFDPQTYSVSTPLTVDGTYYLIVATEDNAGNISEPQSIFTYKFDSTNPVNPNPATLTVSPFGWSTVNNFAFSWGVGSDPGAFSSSIKGYQYKTGASGANWGPVITETSINNIQAYQNGRNEFYVRSVDNAGNVGPESGDGVTKIYYYFNGSAPSKPTSLSVTPMSSTSNSFTFSWALPEAYNNSVKGYYYSINSLPNANNTVFTTDTTISDIAAATQQGFNTFFVVAMDGSENINWGNYETIQFECNTPAPGIPLQPEIFDTSNRDSQKYSAALNWQEPNYKGVGFAGYTVERSIDGDVFNQIGTSSGTSYIDVNLESKRYYYRVKAKDNSGNISAPSEVVSILPTGKYTSPPKLEGEPEVVVKVSTAKIHWDTDREASSFIEIGEDVKYGLTQGQFEFVKDHNVAIERLKPDTIYHYRVKYVDVDGNIGYSSDAALRTLPAPKISNVVVEDIRLYSAVISWNTSTQATSNLYYGKVSPNENVIKNVSGGLTTSHSVRLNNLSHSSNYNFKVEIVDVDGNVVEGEIHSFETMKFPVISMVRMEPVKDNTTATMKFTWETNVPTNSIIEYIPEGGVVQEAVKTKLETKHELLVNGLLDNTFYSVNMKGTDQFGNTATSDLQRFKTAYDTRPPKVSQVTTETSINGFGAEAKAQVIVSWITDEPSTSQVEYNEGVSGESFNMKTQEDALLTTSHMIVISDLKPSSSYYFKTVSRDSARNEGLSEVNSILTDQAKSSILDIIVKTFQNTLGWLFSG